MLTWLLFLPNRAPIYLQKSICKNSLSERQEQTKGMAAYLASQGRVDYQESPLVAEYEVVQRDVAALRITRPGSQSGILASNFDLVFLFISLSIKSTKTKKCRLKQLLLNLKTVKLILEILGFKGLKINFTFL